MEVVVSAVVPKVILEVWSDLCRNVESNIVVLIVED